MPLLFTRPLLAEMTLTLKQRIERAYIQFPELEGQRVVVGLTRKRGLDGYAIGEEFCVRLNVTPRARVSYFTIGHELTHLLQKPGLGIVPDGEVQCDIWTLARSELFLDEMPTYLDVHPCTDKDWKKHAPRVRELCARAIDVRKTRRRYILWLKNRLQQSFTAPVQLDLFNGTQTSGQAQGQPGAG
jgi:hypothetical protein